VCLAVSPKPKNWRHYVPVGYSCLSSLSLLVINIQGYHCHHIRHQGLTLSRLIPKSVKCVCLLAAGGILSLWATCKPHSYDRQHNNKAEYLQMKPKTDIDMCLTYKHGFLATCFDLCFRPLSGTFYYLFFYYWWGGTESLGICSSS
jgi:hypothetical protein